MKNKKLKKIFCILLVLNSFINAVSAASKKDGGDFLLTYLFQKGYGEKAVYSIYKGENLISDLNCLKERKILEIRLDRNSKDSVLFAESSNNLCRVIRLNFLTYEETVLFEFDFKQEMDKYANYRAFTENALFYCNRRENGSKLHVLYEYDSLTKQITKLFEVDPGYISSVMAVDDYIYFYVDGWFDADSGSYVMDRTTGNVRENKINLVSPLAVGHYKNKLIREDSKAEKTGNMIYGERSQKSCVIFDMVTFEETRCTFKKRYERQGGPLILLSEDYFLVPLCIHPFIDSWRNGLFGSNWTVCYTVFDIRKNKAVYNGIVSETSRMEIVDAMM